RGADRDEASEPGLAQGETAAQGPDQAWGEPRTLELGFGGHRTPRLARARPLGAPGGLPGSSDVRAQPAHDLTEPPQLTAQGRRHSPHLAARPPENALPNGRFDLRHARPLRCLRSTTSGLTPRQGDIIRSADALQ